MISHPTASVVILRDGHVLLLVSAKGIGFIYPSGHVEDGENILQAAVRETREETGIALDPASLQLALSIHHRHPGAARCQRRWAASLPPAVAARILSRCSQTLTAPSCMTC